MPLLKVEADKLSNNQLVAGVIEEIIEKDELFALLPTADFLDPNDPVLEDAATFTEVISRLRILIGDVDVDKFLQEVQSDTNDQKATQIALKAKAVARKFKNTLINGDNGGSPKEFDGMKVLTVAGQTIAAGANGAALTLAMLDQLSDTVINGPDAFVMRAGTIRAYRALLRATGGTDAAMIEIPNFGVPVLGHNGTPILRNDYLLATETKGASGAVCCSVYAARLNELDGMHGLYGGSAAGLRVEDVGTVQNKDATRTRIKWYCGVALKSSKSLARLEGVTNT
jgi:hypothetical protein